MWERGQHGAEINERDVMYDVIIKNMCQSMTNAFARAPRKSLSERKMKDFCFYGGESVSEGDIEYTDSRNKKKN